MRWKSSKHRFVPPNNVQNDKALSYGFHREQYVTKENIEAYVTNICAFMMHQKLFGGNETNSYSFNYFLYQLVNFCRQCYLNPNKRITSKFNVTISTASASASKIEKQNLYWEIGHCKLTST